MEPSDIDKNNSKNNKISQHVFYKFSKDISLAEAILLDNQPVFLQIQNGKIIINENIKIGNQLIIPQNILFLL
jgi:hypothetical protein